MPTTVRLPVCREPGSDGLGYVTLTPEHIAQILGDLPGRLEALRKAFLSVPHPTTIEVLRIMEADAPQQDAKPNALSSAEWQSIRDNGVRVVPVIAKPDADEAVAEAAEQAGRGPLGCDELLGADHQPEGKP